MTESLETETGRVKRAADLWFDYLTTVDAPPLEVFLEQNAEHRDLLALMAEGDPTSWDCEGDLTGALDGPDRVEPSLEEQLERLDHHRRKESPFVTMGEIARGGMGRVTMVRDEILRRKVAMKIIRHSDDADASDLKSTDSITLGRFLDEAQVTGQLDHPGVIPVHELGLDASGHAFFTMRLVKGRTLDEIFPLSRSQGEDWSCTRALEVILKVCDTLAYAHSKGVIHRDLKPSNVMVGRFGEVYVMDWGLAKILDREDPRDLRIRPPTRRVQSRVSSDRSEMVAQEPDSPLITMDGAVVGTPCYMPPEQADGRIEELGPRSEVYSVGAMLYTLLTGRRPYLESDSPLSPYAVLAAVAQGPPKAIHSIDRSASSELAAICEKAMARRIEDRYGSMEEMAADLRAFLDQQVVSAYRTGPIAEMHKWVVRNKGFAVACHAVLLALIAGLVVSPLFHRREAPAERGEVESQRSQIGNSFALAQAESLVELRRRAAKELWPADSRGVAAMMEWIEEARLLRDRLEDCRSCLENLQRMKADLAPAAPAGSRAWLLARLRAHASELEAFLSGPAVLPDGVAGMHGTSLPAVMRRLAIARGLRGRTTEEAMVAQSWEVAIQDIADPGGEYGFHLEKQEGLIPLARNPRSGLWEFWLPLSGAEPERDPEWYWKGEEPPAVSPLEHPSRWELEEATGLVFILIPGGRFDMGGSPGPGAAHHDPRTAADAGPIPLVTVAPYFLSKYEMTRVQWCRTMGAPASRLNPPNESRLLGTRSARLDPVVSISLDEVLAGLGRLGMTLPTEAQWEYAARAGTTAPRFVFEDGGPARSPIGRYRATGYGLHDVSGNVAEWCLAAHSLNGAHAVSGGELDVLRGGGDSSRPEGARSSWRLSFHRENRDATTGLRPVVLLRR